MKKLALATIMATAVSTASAFDFPFNDNNNYYGYVEDNGIFAFNPWEMTDPRWYATEFTNMVNEVSDPDYVTSYQPAWENPNYYGAHTFPAAPVAGK